MSRSGVSVAVNGAEHIPVAGPCVLTTNHYSRSGFSSWWFVLCISSLVPAPVHWVTAQAWTWINRKGERVRQPFTTWAFEHMAEVYGFSSMPPIPPIPSEDGQRAMAVRRVLNYARLHPQSMIGLAPEGGDSPDGRLQPPPAGAGRFMLHLARLGFRFVPIGFYEESDRIVVNFGSSYTLRADPGVSTAGQDLQASRTVMRAIAAQLPPALWGNLDDESHRGGEYDPEPVVCDP